MPDTTTVEEIQRNLACPACQYNLRGLRGAVVTCPECGKTADVARLLASQWTQSLWLVPRLFEVEAPAVAGAYILAFLGAYLVIPRSTPETAGYQHMMRLLLLLGIGLLPLWIWRIVCVRRQWPGLRGVQLAIVAHGFIPIWYLLIVAPLFGIAILLGGIRSHAPRFILIGALILCMEAFLFWGYRRARRWIAMRCLQRYLEEASQA